MIWFSSGKGRLFGWTGPGNRGGLHGRTGNAGLQSASVLFPDSDDLLTAGALAALWTKAHAGCAVQGATLPFMAFRSAAGMPILPLQA